MNLEKIRKPLMMAFAEDHKINCGPSHITDLIIISIKCLVPSENDLGVCIDYRRYMEEVKLWQYYKNGQNSSLINTLNNVDAYTYWQEKDDTVLFRIIPIVLANNEYSTIRNEVITNVLFTTGNIEMILEALLISKFLHLTITHEKDVINKLKEEVIKFSQVEFKNNYQKLFKAPIEDYSGNFSVDFERYRIYALSVLNQTACNWFDNLQKCLNVYLNNLDESNIISRCIGANLTDEYNNMELAEHYTNLGAYIYRLRKGRINPEALRIKKYELPDVFQFNEGDIFFHSLLSKSKVTRKEIANQKTIVHVSTKLGTYRFIR